MTDRVTNLTQARLAWGWTDYHFSRRDWPAFEAALRKAFEHDPILREELLTVVRCARESIQRVASLESELRHSKE